ncbi:MAG: hypothetical protein ACLVH3_05490 [Blautia obeum]
MSLKDLVRREISSSESGTSSGSDRFCACTWRILSLNLRRGGQGSSGDKPGTDTAEKNNDTCGNHALEQKIVFGILDLVFQIRDEDFWIYIDGDRV